MEKEKVSIVLPTYNLAKYSDYLKQSINSCLNQTHKNIELIIVDDGSTDNTQQIVSEFNDKRIKFIQHKKNLGLPKALNTGFSNATGDFFSWTSDDNFYSFNAIAKMLFFLKENNCEFVFTDLFEINTEKNSHGIVKYSDQPDLSKGNSIGGCFLYSKKVKETIGEYDSETILAEDFDFWIRISKKFSLRHLAEPLYSFRIHKTSLYYSRKFEVNVIDFLLRLKHNLINSAQATNLFIDLIAEKNKKSFFEKILLKFFPSKNLKKINTLLKQFEKKEKTFSETKKELLKLI
ncbi:MAG: glycosyltransferase [Candidatus Diapherotrites archaeon CG10_big_fil_rev_8_21_14_0_10_31_34]|nr:MAG: glycosyltransferase [Candidatus Diapherotrites archaeon CG10_big_fil_rev_8_21_14_0_10_31_34]